MQDVVLPCLPVFQPAPAAVVRHAVRIARAVTGAGHRAMHHGLRRIGGFVSHPRYILQAACHNAPAWLAVGMLTVPLVAPLHGKQPAHEVIAGQDPVWQDPGADDPFIALRRPPKDDPGSQDDPQSNATGDSDRADNGGDPGSQVVTMWVPAFASIGASSSSATTKARARTTAAPDAATSDPADPSDPASSDPADPSDPGSSDPGVSDPAQSNPASVDPAVLAATSQSLTSDPDPTSVPEPSSMLVLATGVVALATRRWAAAPRAGNDSSGTRHFQ